MTAVLHEGRRINPPPPVGYRSFGQPPTLTHRADGRPPFPRLRLTEDQWRCLRLAALGLTSEEIAKEIGRSRSVIRGHLERAYRRVDASCLVDALRAVGWLQVPAA